MAKTRSRNPQLPRRPLLSHPITIAGVLTAIAILLYAACDTPPPNPTNVHEVGPVPGAPDGR